MNNIVGQVVLDCDLLLFGGGSAGELSFMPADLIHTVKTSMCIPILVTTFPEWLSGTEPLPHTPGAVRPSSLCL